MDDVYSDSYKQRMKFIGNAYMYESLEKNKRDRSKKNGFDQVHNIR